MKSLTPSPWSAKLFLRRNESGNVFERKHRLLTLFLLQLSQGEQNHFYHINFKITHLVNLINKKLFSSFMSLFKILKNFKSQKKSVKIQFLAQLSLKSPSVKISHTLPILDLIEILSGAPGTHLLQCTRRTHCGQFRNCF